MQSLSLLKKPYDERLIIAVMFFLLYLVAFGLMLFPHNSPDTFDFSMNNGYKSVLLNGRVAAYFATLLFKGMDMFKMSWLTSILSMIFLTASSIIVYSKISRTLGKNSLIAAGAIAILFCNTFMAEIFYFTEVSYAITLSILFATLALLPVKRDMQVEDFLDSMTLLLISLNFYQAALGYYVALSLVLIYFYYGGNLTRAGIQDSFKALASGLTASLACFMELRLLQITGIINKTGRSGDINFGIITENLRTLYGVISERVLLTGNLTYPKYFLLIFLAIVHAVLIFAMYKRRATLRNYVYCLAIIMISRAAVYAPHMLTTSIWPTPRSILSFWSILSVPVLFIEFWRDNININVKRIALSIVILILGLNIACSNFIEFKIFASNKADREVSQKIQARINEYENDTGNKVEKIIFRNDDRPTWVYKSVGYGCYDICTRLYSTSWGAGVSLMGYVSNRLYEKRAMTDEEFSRVFEEVFNKRDWDALNLDEQLAFSGNICYLVSY